MEGGKGRPALVRACSLVRVAGTPLSRLDVQITGLSQRNYFIFGSDMPGFLWIRRT